MLQMLKNTFSSTPTVNRYFRIDATINMLLWIKITLLSSNYMY